MKTPHNFDFGGLMKKGIKRVSLLVACTFVVFSVASLAGFFLFFYWTHAH